MTPREFADSNWGAIAIAIVFLVTVMALNYYLKTGVGHYI
jgi:hypothetical protein